MIKIKKTLSTVFIIGLVLLLVAMFKYFQFLKLPEQIQDNYLNFISYPGIGGIIPIFCVLGGIYLVFDIWKISAEEKLIKSGRKNDVQIIKKLFSEGILSEKEVENKYKILLKEVIIEKELYVSNIENNKKLDLIKNLSELKDRRILTQQEFDEKREMILGKNQFKQKIADIE